MNQGVILLLGVGIMIAVFTLLLVLFQEKHPLLRYVFLMGVLVTMFFVPTGVYHARTDCSIVPANETITGNTTEFSYRQECFTTTSTDGADTFYTVMWSLYQILIVYFIARIAYLMFSPLWEKMKR